MSNGENNNIPEQTQIPEQGQPQDQEAVSQEDTKKKGGLFGGGKQKPKKSEQKQKKESGLDVSGIKETLINYIVPLASLVGSILIGVFILMPSYKSIPQLSAEREEKVRLESSLEDKLNNLNRLLEFRSVVEENSDLVNKVLVSEKLVPGLLTQIDKIARDSGLQVKSLNYGLGSSITEDAAEYDTVTVNLGVNGSFAQLKTFMNNVENAARIIIVESFRYGSGSQGNAEELSINFILVSPYLYVESDAVTDEPIDLDISDSEFQSLINEIKALKYYDPYEIDETVPVVETPEEETEEGAETEEGTTEEESETTETTEDTGETTSEETTEDTTGEDTDEGSEDSVFGG